MKINVANLGAIKQAEFELGELTIICGGNNTGKTYITHGLYGLLDYLESHKESYIKKETEFLITEENIECLYKTGTVQISIENYVKNISKYLTEKSKEYSRLLHQIFSGHNSHFSNSNITLSLSNTDFKINSLGSTINYDDFGLKVTNRNGVIVARFIDKKIIELSVLSRSISSSTKQSKAFVQSLMESCVDSLISEHLYINISNVFLSSAERTGASIFQKELDFTRNRLVDVLQTDISIGSQLLGKFSNTYPLAIKKNVDFIREMPTLSGKESYVAREHPQILADFADIIGGNYHISQDGDISFQPNHSEQSVKLALHESSSAVRSLLDIGFYLRHVAQKGDLLMVDEPELNLHPENQRRVARLFTQLVNIGIKVFITTHSDYIIKELNTLIMFNQGGERLDEIAKQEGYQQNEFLDHNKVKVYIAEKAPIKTEACNTLTPANIDAEYGIEARSFDTTINDMNRIQEEIVWGE